MYNVSYRGDRKLPDNRLSEISRYSKITQIHQMMQVILCRRSPVKVNAPTSCLFPLQCGHFFHSVYPSEFCLSLPQGWGFFYAIIKHTPAASLETYAAAFFCPKSKITHLFLAKGLLYCKVML